MKFFYKSEKNAKIIYFDYKMPLKNNSIFEKLINNY